MFNPKYLINENLENETDIEETIYRGCTYSGLGDGCVNFDFDGYQVAECFCTTDNCNKDNQCDCSSSTGLKCQRCDGENGQCSSPSDNGKSVTCAEDQDACFFQSISTFTTK